MVTINIRQRQPKNIALFVAHIQITLAHITMQNSQHNKIIFSIDDMIIVEFFVASEVGFLKNSSVMTCVQVFWSTGVLSDRFFY